MSDIRTLYSKLQKVPNTNLPDLETFEKKYNSKEGLETIYSKLQSHPNVNLPSKDSFVSKYSSVPTTTPTQTTTSPTTTEVKAPIIPIQPKTDISINVPLLKNMFTAPSKPENKVEQNVGTYLLGQDTQDLIGNKPQERTKQSTKPLELTPNGTLSPTQTYKNIAANSIDFNQNANIDEETGIDRTTGLPVQKWLQIDNDLAIKGQEQANKLNEILYAKDIPWESDPSKGIVGKSEQITQFNADLYKDALTQKNEINDYYSNKIQSINGSIQYNKYWYNRDHKKSRLDKIEQLRLQKPILEKEYQEKLSDREKIIQGLDATTASTSVLRPDAVATRDNPNSLIDATDQDILLNAAKYTYETEAMNQPELKAGYLEKFNKDINGQKLTDIINNKFTPTLKGFSLTPSLTQSDVESQGEKIVGNYDINTIDFQKKTLAGIETLRNNVRANIPMFDNVIKELADTKLKVLQDSAKNNSVVDPKYIEYIDNQIKDYTDKRVKQDLLLKKFDTLENKYFKDAKDFDIYTKTRDKDSETLNAISDVIQPLYLGTANKVDKIPNSLESMGLAIADGLDMVSKEERVSKELKMYADNKNDALTYVPEFIKNTQAFKITRGKDGSIKWTESLDGRAILREGIKTTAESAMLYGTGLGIGKATKLESILGKSGSKVANYFADKIGILPASLVEMNDIDNQEFEAYLRGDYNNINNEFSSTMRKKLIEGGTEMIWTPEAKFFKGLEKQPIKQFTLKQLFTQSLGKSLVNAELQPIIKVLFENLIAVPAEEFGEEVAGNIANQPFEGLQASNNLRYKAQDQLTLDNNIETVVNTTIGMIPTMLFGVSTQSYNVLKSSKFDYNYELASNPEYEKYALEALDKISEDKLLKVLPQYSSKKEAVEATIQEYDNLKTSYKESAPYSRFLPSDKQKTELFNNTLELKRLVSNTDPQLTQEELTKRAERLITLTDSVNSLREQANQNKKEIAESTPLFLDKHIDSFINDLDKETITPLAIDAIKTKLEQWKSTLEINPEEHKEAITKINNELDYYNTRLEEITNEIVDINENKDKLQEEEDKTTAQEILTPQEETTPTQDKFQELSIKLDNATLDDIDTIEDEILDIEDETKKTELYNKFLDKQASLQPQEETTKENPTTPQEEAPQQTPQDLIPSIREVDSDVGGDAKQNIKNKLNEEIKSLEKDLKNIKFKDGNTLGTLFPSWGVEAATYVREHLNGVVSKEDYNKAVRYENLIRNFDLVLKSELKAVEQSLPTTEAKDKVVGSGVDTKADIESKIETISNEAMRKTDKLSISREIGSSYIWQQFGLGSNETADILKKAGWYISDNPASIDFNAVRNNLLATGNIKALEKFDNAIKFLTEKRSEIAKQIKDIENERDLKIEELEQELDALDNQIIETNLIVVENEKVQEEKLNTKVDEVVNTANETEQKRIKLGDVNLNPLGTVIPYNKQDQNHPIYLRTQRTLLKLRELQLKDPIEFSKKYFGTVQKNLDKLLDQNSEGKGLSDEILSNGVIVLITNEQGEPYLFDNEGNISKDGFPVFQNFNSGKRISEDNFKYQTGLVISREDKEKGDAYDVNTSKVKTIRETLDKEPTKKITFTIEEITPSQNEQKSSEKLVFTTKDLVSGQTQILSQVEIPFAGKDKNQTVQRYVVNVKNSLGVPTLYDERMPKISTISLKQTLKDLLDLTKTEGLPEDLQDFSNRREFLRSFMFITYDGVYKKYKNGDNIKTPLRYFFVENNEVKVELKTGVLSLEDWYNSRDFEFLELNENNDYLGDFNFSMYNWDNAQNKFIPTAPSTYKDFILSNIEFKGKDIPQKISTIKLDRDVSFKPKEKVTGKNKTELDRVLDEIKDNITFIKGLTSTGKQVDIDSGESYDSYINTKTGTIYKRVTDYISDKPFEGNDLTNSATTIGTKVDNLVRDFFEGTLKPIEEYYLSSKTIVEPFLKELESLKKELDSRGENVLASGIVLYNETLKIAGTVDLLTYDKNGNFHIYDMKTMRGDQTTERHKSGVNKNKIKYSNPYNEGEDSNKDKHTKQLSLYRILLNNTHGILADKLTIIPIEVQYNAGDNITKKLNSLKLIPLTPQNKVKDAVVISQEIPTTKVEPIIPQESPIEEKPKSGKKVFKKLGNGLSDEPLTRLKSLPTKKLTPAQINKATDWFNKYQAKTGVSLENMVDTVNDKSFAQWHKGIITLFNASTSPDLYHEAFHDFTQLYLSKAQKISLYNEISKTKEGIKILKSLPKDATDLQKYHAIEELLAEDFRKYMISDQKLILGERPKRNSIFRRMYNFLKEFFTNQPSLETIYKNLANNKIKGKRDFSNAIFGTLNSSIPGLNEEQTQNVFRVVDSIVATKFREIGLSISNLFKDKTKLQRAYNDVHDSLAELYNELEDTPENEQEIKSLEFLLTNWDNIKLSHIQDSPLLKLSKEYFRVDEKEFDEENPDVKGSIYDDDESKSVRDKASAQLIYLIATQPAYIQVDGKQLPKPNHFLPLVQDIVDFNTMWNSVADTLKGTLTYQEQYKKLQEKAKTNLSFQSLVNSLPNPSEDLTTLSAQLRNQFTIMFSQPLIPMKINNLRYQADGTLNVVANNATVSSLRRVNEDWKYNLQSSRNSYTTTNSLSRNELNLDKVIEDFVNIGTRPKETKINFLNALGINLSHEAENSKDFQDFLSDRYNLKRLYDSLKVIKEQREDTTLEPQELAKATQPIYDIITTLSSIGDQAKLKELADIEINNGDKYFGDNMLNASGESVWGIRQYSQQSMMYTYLNDAELYPNYISLINSPIGAVFNTALNPDANNIYLKSLFNLTQGDNYGERILDKKGKPIQISLYNHNGLSITSSEELPENGEGTLALTRFMKAIQDMSTLLETGEKEHLRYGDKTTSNGTLITFKREGSLPAFNPHIPVDIKDFKTSYLPEQAYLIFKNRLLTTLKRTNDFFINDTLKYATAFSTNVSKGDYFGILDGMLTKETKDILSKDIKDKQLNLEELLTTNEAVIKKDITNYMKSLVDDYAKELSKNKLVDPSNYLSTYLLDTHGFETILKAYITNSYILNMEHISLFFQDIRFYTDKNNYKEPFKRLAKSTSTGVRLVNDPQINSFLQGTDEELKKYNEKNGTNILERDKSLPKLSAIFNDITYSKDSPTLEGLLTMLDEIFSNASKEDLLNIRKSYIDMKPTDAMAFSTFDAYREFSIKSGNDEWSLEKENLYKKIASETPLSEEETKSSFLFFPPLKLRVVGYTQDKEGNVIPIDYKFAISPLLGTIVKGKGYEAIKDNMLRQQVSLGLFNTASKHSSVGVLKDGKLQQNALYNEDGTPNTSDWVLNPIQQDFIYEVVPSPKDYKEDVTFSTQLRKLLFVNSFNNGIPTDYKGSKNFNSLTEAEKLKSSYIYSLDNTLSNTINDLVTLEKDKLLTKIGATLNTDTNKYTFDDVKLSALLEDEILKRNLGSNALESLKIVNDKFKYSLDSSLQRETLEQILLSIVDNKLRKQKGLGESLIQASSIGYENNTLTRTDSWKDTGGWDLPYYGYEGRTLSDGTKVTSAHKIKVALQGDFKKLLNLKEVQELATKDNITPLQALNTIIKDEELLDKYNIRDLISTTAVRIPVQGHNSMEFMEVYEFLPTEAGSVVIVSPALVAKSGGDFDWDKLTTLFHSFNINKKGEITNYDSPSEQQTKNLFKSLAEEFGLSLTQEDNTTSELTAKLFGTSQEELDKIILEESQKEKFDAFIAKKYYNNVINSTIRKVLERPENIQQLLTPNSTDLLEPLADARKAALSPKKFSWSDVASPQESLNQHESNSVGKQSLGILAVANTFFSQLQRAGAYMNKNFRKDLNNPKTRPINHRLNHNKTSAGNISLSSIMDSLGINRISEVFSQLMNGAVDVAKKDWIFYVNGIKELIPTMAYLNMTGTPVLENIAFLTQPIINDFIETLKNYKSPIVKYTNRNAYNLAKVHAIYETIQKYAKPGSKYFEDLTEKYNQVLEDSSKAPFFYGFLNNDMANIADKYNTYFEFDKFKDFSIPVEGKLKVPTTQEEKFAQVLYLVQFLEFEAQQSTLSSVRTTMAQDTKKPTNLQDAKERLLKQEEAHNYEILPKSVIDKLVNESTTKAFTSPTNGIDAFIGKLLDKVFDVTDHPVFNQFLKDEYSKPHTYNPVLQDKQTKEYYLQQGYSNIPFNVRYDLKEAWVKTVKNDFIEYLAKNHLYLPNDPTTKVANYFFSNLINYNKGLHITLDAIKDKFPDLLNNNLLLQYLQKDPSRTKVRGVPQYMNLKLKKDRLEPEEQKILVEAFKELINFDNPQYSVEDQVLIRAFAKDLAYLSFNQSGLNSSKLSFTKIIPEEFYSEDLTNVLRAFKKLLDEKPQEAIKEFNTFYKLFKKNNPKFFKANDISELYSQQEDSKPVLDIDFAKEPQRGKNYVTNLSNDLLSKREQALKLQQEKQLQHSREISSQTTFTSNIAKDNPKNLYVYNSNTDNNNKYQNMSIKLENNTDYPNTINIPTYKSFNQDYTDKDFATVKPLIDTQIQNILTYIKQNNPTKVVFPQNILDRLNTAPSLKNYIEQQLSHYFDLSKETPIFTEEITNMEEDNKKLYTNHSGGAEGGDLIWDSEGRKIGINNHNHYTVAYYDKLSTQEKEVLNTEYLETVKFLGRGVISKDTYAGKLVRRDMLQANKGNAIFGITELVKPNTKGRKGYSNKMLYSIPEGGTGYALARGILSNKPTYVFNQSSEYGNEIGWYKWNNVIKDFEKTITPTLTKDFTGIGSREINSLGKQAIADVYEKTFNNNLIEEDTIPQEQPESTNIFDEEVLPTRQLDLFSTQFDNLEEFNKERKEEILSNYQEKHNISREKALEDINKGLELDKELMIKNLKDCY